MKTVLITGATGYLGKHVVPRLLEAEPEARLRVMSRDPADLPENSLLERVQGDVISRDDVLAAAGGLTRALLRTVFILAMAGGAWGMAALGSFDAFGIGG